MHREREWFYAHPEVDLREVEWIHFGRYLHERSQGKPTQYITKRQEFYGREFRVTPEVLIPRPETELLAETVLKRLGNSPDSTVIDVGTGSGAIAITLALESFARIVATDVSGAALAVAAANASRLAARVQFLRADLLSIFGDECAEGIVSNPPYVADADRATLQREVRDWEPGQALFAGPDGLDVYRRLIPEAERVLRPGGLLALEIGFGQNEAISLLANRWNDVELLNDLAGIPRVLVCAKSLRKNPLTR